MDAKLIFDSAKSFSDVLEKRFVFLRMLMFPISIIILAFYFAPSRVEPIRHIIPHYNWIDILLKIQDTVLHLLAESMFILIVIVLVWKLISKLIAGLFHRDWEPNWSKPVSYGLSYILECSAWWWCFYGFSILYLEKPVPFNLELDDKLAWPVLLLSILKILGWMFGNE